MHVNVDTNIYILQEDLKGLHTDMILVIILLNMLCYVYIQGRKSWGGWE